MVMGRLLAALLTSALVCLPWLARADTYPSKPIRLIVPFGAGGSADIVARLLAPPLSQALGQQLVIDNRAGAGGTLGATLAAQAPADGYTLLFSASGPNAVAPSIYANLAYDTVRGFAPVTLLSVQPAAVVATPTLQATSLAELVALARRTPGALNYGSPGVGTTSHLGGELFAMLAGIRMEHVPYKEGRTALLDLSEGRIQLMFDNLGQFLPLIREGKLKALAVAGDQRTSLLPELPTAAEAGLPGYGYSIWFGLSAPAQTPPDIVALLNARAAAVVARPEVVAALAGVSAEPRHSTPEAFRGFIAAETAKWAEATKAAGIKPQ